MSGNQGHIFRRMNMNETRLHELGKLKASAGMETEIKNKLINQYVCDDISKDICN